MAHPLMWIILAVQALAQAKGLPAQALPPAAPQATDPLALRQQQWQHRRVLDLDEDGYAVRNGRRLDRSEQVRLYRRTDAGEALDLMRQSRGKSVVGGFWLVGVTGALALAGSQVGQEEDARHAAAVGSNGNDSTYQAWGTAGGILAGLMIGGTIRHFYAVASDDLRAQAAESYNRKLLDDLQLGAAPIPGGMQLGLSGRF